MPFEQRTLNTLFYIFTYYGLTQMLSVDKVLLKGVDKRYYFKSVTNHDWPAYYF